MNSASIHHARESDDEWKEKERDVAKSNKKLQDEVLNIIKLTETLEAKTFWRQQTILLTIWLTDYSDIASNRQLPHRRIPF